MQKELKLKNKEIDFHRSSKFYIFHSPGGAEIERQKSGEAYLFVKTLQAVHDIKKPIMIMLL